MSSTSIRTSLRTSLALALALAAALPAGAQTVLRVPLDASTIQDAIGSVQDGDTILVLPGTYPEQIDFFGKAITVASTDGPAVTIIDGNGAGPVVTCDKDEGPDSVLRGFTITGGHTVATVGAGVSCSGSTVFPGRPTIADCVIRANRTDANGGGVGGGAPTLVDCVIEDNEATGEGGGVWGAPNLVRCDVRRNRAHSGGGLALSDGTVEDTSIRDNVSDDGATGGGLLVQGSPSLRRVLISGNHARSNGQFPSRGAGVRVVSGSPLLLQCTIVANVVDVPHFFAEPDTGGIHGRARLVNSILRGNDADELDPVPSRMVVFSDVEGGFPGLGNFDLDPQFADAASGDYRLLAGSPCIDAGAPSAPVDPDGSRPDLGAFPYPRATAFVRNGSGVNPLVLESLVAPLLGTSWSARIDAGPVARASVLFGRTGALAPGRMLPAGELLLDPASRFVFVLVRASAGGPDDFTLGIPADPALIGFTVHAQGLVLGSRARLSNALELHMGL